MKRYLVLENGNVYEGEAMGAEGSVISEIVFTTAMTAYLETLTDPSYKGQAVVQTFPLIGNYGIITPDMESSKINVSGYIVREVKVGDPVVDDDGYVISYSSLIPVNEAGELKVNAVDAYNEESREYTYKAHYDQGEIQGVNSNIREDIVTNSRPGIEVRKTDWSGAALANAVFTFKDEDGKDVGANASFKSGKDGFVTTAYLPADGTFYLKETGAPKGFIGLSDPITITMEDGHETVEAGDADSEAVSYETIDGVKTITIKNRSYELKDVKSDEEGNALENVEFALYKQVTDATTGEPRKDIRPMAGYESLKTDENGIIPKITNELRPGTYYLSEVEPLEGYALIAGDLVFTISQSGAVTIVAGSDRSITEDKIDTMTSYTITLINREADAKVSFKKVDIENTDVPLAGAKFDLYGTKSDGSREDEPLYRDMISQSDGMLKIGTDKTEFDLGSGVYQLIETEAPAGYVITAYKIRGISQNGNRQFKVQTPDTVYSWINAAYNKNGNINRDVNSLTSVSLKISTIAQYSSGPWDNIPLCFPEFTVTLKKIGVTVMKVLTRKKQKNKMN